MFNPYDDPFGGMRSPPVELHWRGWRAYSPQLQACGWRFKGQMNTDYGYPDYVLLGHDPQSGLTMRATIRRDHMEVARRGDTIPVEATFLPETIRMIRLTEPTYFVPHDLEDLDLRPQYSKYSEDLFRPGDLFAKAGPSGQPDVEPLAFEEEHIPEVLARIRELQTPRAREILHRTAREAEDRRRIITPAQTFHANIISLSEVAA